MRLANTIFSITLFKCYMYSLSHTHTKERSERQKPNAKAVLEVVGVWMTLRFPIVCTNMLSI